MPANYTFWDLQLIDENLDKVIDDDTGLYTVYQASVPLPQTCYSDMSGTALTMPATMLNGRMSFFTASSVATVDISIMTALGRAFFRKAVTPSEHRQPVNPNRSAYTLVGAWAILSAHADGVVSAVAAPCSGGLPVGIQIKQVYVHKTSVGVGVGAGLIVDFGVSGDPDGFIDGITATATGYEFVNVNLTSITTDVAGATDIISLLQQRGALIHNHSVGLLTATTGGAKGYFVPKPYMISLVTTTNNLVFAVNGTSALTTVAGSRGYVFYEYELLATAGF